ncbi:MAG: histidine phosphatase family protein [Melioribacteraceae bacterium]|jgi:phosphohistidine phosphatase|nr:histidine phosphatase family protein [Melioribacteraceae bacterium]
MKHLYLVRHAKSSWDNPSHSDFERPLNKRGLRDAPFMAKLLNDKIGRIDLLVSSPASRAISTAKEFASFFNFKESEILRDERIYEASLTDLYCVVKELSDNYNSTILFGHNPTISMFADNLTKEFRWNMPTCGIVGIELWINSWAEISKDIGKVLFFEFPKKYFDKD